MDKFEYKIVHGLIGESELNALGRSGWELIQYVPNDMYIFKKKYT
jgi:hypothetical protein